MKTTQLTVSTVQLPPALEEFIRKSDGELKDLAEKNAIHFASKKPNLPQPVGDSLDHYTGELKAGYEKMNAEVFQLLQPASHIPEGRMEADYFKEKDKNLDEEIKDLDHKNLVQQSQFKNASSRLTYTRILLTFIITFIITVGEIMFNTKSFQVTGENMLFALILAIAVSFAVFAFSHMVPLLFKAAKNKLQRVFVLGGSLLLILGLFTALAIFRSQYLASHDVHIQPIYFVVINLFFFIVSSLLSFFIMPDWQEIKQNAAWIKAHFDIRKRNKKIEKCKKEKEKLIDTIATRTAERVRILNCASYCADRIRKMYYESVAIFKRVNLAHRTDGKTPDCFSDKLSQPDMNEVVFNSPANRKLQ